jgi:hypothetical protein
MVATCGHQGSRSLSFAFVGRGCAVNGHTSMTVRENVAPSNLLAVRTRNCYPKNPCRILLGKSGEECQRVISLNRPKCG